MPNSALLNFIGDSLRPCGLTKRPYSIEKVLERPDWTCMSTLRNIEFVTTVAHARDLLPPHGAEVAFAGRSNAGKSSAINALAQRKRMAFVSKTPGRTQHINFFRLRSGALLADLPGYVYAEVPAAIRRHWQHFIARYLAERVP